jgi:hypothetical protein
MRRPRARWNLSGRIVNDIHDSAPAVIGPADLAAGIFPQVFRSESSAGSATLRPAARALAAANRWRIPMPTL